MAEVFCTQCGAKMNSSVRFCSACGTPNQAFGAAPAVQQNVVIPSAPAAPKKKKHGTLIFLIVVVLFFGGAVAIGKLLMHSYGNTDNGRIYYDTVLYDEECQMDYSGGLQDGKPDGKGTGKAILENISVEMSGTWGDGELTDGTKTAVFSDNDKYYKIIDEGSFSANELDGSGKRLVYYTKEQRASTGIEYIELTGDFNYGIAEGKAELTKYYTQEKSAENGADYIIYSGNYKNGSLIEPYDQIMYKDGQIVMKGVVEKGAFYKDDKYKNSVEILTEALLEEYKYDLELIEVIGEGVTNMLS